MVFLDDLSREEIMKSICQRNSRRNISDYPMMDLMISNIFRDLNSNSSSVITFFSHDSKCVSLNVVDNLPPNVNFEMLSIIKTSFSTNFHRYRKPFIEAREPPRRRAIAFDIGNDTHESEIYAVLQSF